LPAHILEESDQNKTVWDW